MSQTDEQKIIEIRVRYDDAVNGVAKYTQAIEKLKQEQQKLKRKLDDDKISLMEYHNAMAQNKREIKTYQSDIRVLNRELQNNVKEQRENEGSLVSLRAQLSRLTQVYDQLSKEMRNGDYGMNLGKQIAAVSTELKEAEAVTQRFYRNVGNYQSAWNGLGMSIQQIGRELPSLAMGWNTFFLAISNNLPILSDEIKRAKDEYNELKKAGQQATPVWKQIVSSLVSWQTALTVGITLLTLYGKEIIDWVGNLFKGKKAVDALKQEQAKLSEEMRSARQSAAQETAELRVLYAMTQNQTASMESRLAAVDKLQQQYPAYFGNLSKEAILAGEASAAYQQLSKDIMSAAYAKAYQERIEKLAAENVEEYRGSQADFNYMQRNRKAYEDAIEYINSAQGKADKNQYAFSFTDAKTRAQSGVTIDPNAIERYKKYAQIISDFEERRARWQRHNQNYKRNEETMSGYVDEITKLQDTMTRLEQSTPTSTGGAPVTSASSHENDIETTNVEDIRQRELEEARKAQDLLTELVKDSYERRRQQVSQEYDRQIEDLRHNLEAEQDLTVKSKESINSQITSLEELKNRELDKLSDEQMQKDIEAEQQRIQYLLTAAGVLDVLQVRLGDILAEDDVVAVGALHHGGDLPHLQGQCGLLKLADHLAGVGHIAVGVGGQARVLGVLVHQLVKGGDGVLGGLDLGEELVGLGLLLGHGVRVQGLPGGGIGGEEEDVLGAVVPVGLDIVVQGGLVHLAHQLIHQVVVQIAEAVDALEGLVGDAIAVQVRLIGLLAAALLNIVRQIRLELLLLLLSEAAVLLPGLLLHGEVVGHQVHRVLPQELGVGGAVAEGLLPVQGYAVLGHVVDPVAAVVGQPVQVVLRVHVFPVDGDHHRVGIQAGHRVGHLVDGVLPLILLAGGQGKYQGAAQGQAGQAFENLHAALLHSSGDSPGSWRAGARGGIVAQVASQLGFHPGHQFQGIEGFCEVIVRPQGQAGDLVHVLHLGREHQDGEQMLLPDPAAQGEPVDIREHDVQNGKVQMGAGHAVQGFLSGVEFVDGEALVPEIDLHQVGNGGFVVHH